MISIGEVKELWNEIANAFNIKLTPQEYEEVLEILQNNLCNFFEEKIVEQDKLLEEMNQSGVR